MENDKIIIGIDPGVNGGLCVIYGDIVIAQKFTVFSDYRETICEQMIKGLPLKVFVEKLPKAIHGIRTSPAIMAVLHDNAGFCRGMLFGLGVAYEEVEPREWQKGLPGLAKLDYSARKRALHELALQRYPGAKATLKTCDAILIAEYGRRKELGK